MASDNRPDPSMPTPMMPKRTRSLAGTAGTVSDLAASEAPAIPALSSRNSRRDQSCGVMVSPRADGGSYYAAANARRIYPFLGGPTMPTARTPVLFIPGLWMHADSWKSWVDLFRSAGYEPTARSWPGVATTVAETRAHPETMAGRGLTG